MTTIGGCERRRSCSIDALEEVVPVVPRGEILQHAEQGEADRLVEPRCLEAEGIDKDTAATALACLRLCRSHQRRADALTAERLRDEQQLHMQPLEAGPAPKSSSHRTIVISYRVYPQSRLCRADQA